MNIPGKWKSYFHSLVGIAIAMVVIGFTLSFLRNKGPAIIQGPASTAGNAIFGSRFNF